MSSRRPRPGTSCFLLVPASALVLLLALSGPAFANGAQVGFQAGMIFPIRSDAIQLVSERVHVDLKGPLDEGWVDSGYTLRNLSDSLQTFQMAFSPYGFLSDSPGYRSRDFRVMARGETLPVRFERVDGERWSPFTGANNSTFPVWDLSIAALDSLQLGIRYRIAWAGDGLWRFAYNARPASLWAGTVNHATIAFEFDEFQAAVIRCALNGAGCIRVVAYPAGAAWKGNALVWDFRDWEPTEDVGIDVALHE